MVGIFSWLRSSVKAAFLAGMNDAIEEIQSARQVVEPVALQLEAREPVEPEAARGNGRARARA